MKKLFVYLLLHIIIWQPIIAQKFEGLAKTPPMGWNTWNKFGFNFDEKIIRDVADAFIKNGLKDAGYEYIILDDGWMSKERDKDGNLVPDPRKFPSGMKALGDYIHAKGLKFGIYNCAGTKTCGGYPGGAGYEERDANLYASWGVDFLKYDWCNTNKIHAQTAYATMRDAIKKAGRPMIFSICEWGLNQPWTWGKDVGHMWRVTGDIANCWNCSYRFKELSTHGILPLLSIRKKDNIRKYAGPGHWNDYDMLEVGNGMSDSQNRSHFAVWCMLSSPLILGNDLSKMNWETVNILTNKEIIDINKDSLAIESFRYKTLWNIDIWARPLKNDEWAICFVNRNGFKMKLQFNWSKHIIEDEFFNRKLDCSKQVYNLRDLYLHQQVGTTEANLEKEIGKHDVLLLKLTKK
jgi:alpha-galactosidase